MMMEPAQSIESMKGSHREWVGNGPRHPPAWATSGAGRPTGGARRWVRAGLLRRRRWRHRRRSGRAASRRRRPAGGWARARLRAQAAAFPGKEGSAAGGHRSDGAPGAPARGVRAPTTGAAPRAPGAAQLGQASCDGDSCESCDNNTRLSDRRLPAMCDCDSRAERLRYWCPISGYFASSGQPRAVHHGLPPAAEEGLVLDRRGIPVRRKSCLVCKNR